MTPTAISLEGGPGSQGQLGLFVIYNTVLSGTSMSHNNNMIAPAVGYRIEGTGGDAPPQVADCNVPNLTQGVFDLSDNDTKYYRDNFLDKRK